MKLKKLIEKDGSYQDIYDEVFNHMKNRKDPKSKEELQHEKFEKMLDKDLYPVNKYDLQYDLTERDMIDLEDEAGSTDLTDHEMDLMHKRYKIMQR